MHIDRKASVTKVIHSRLGKELIKEKRDMYRDLPTLTEFLLGENLADKNKQLIKSVRASVSCMQTNLAFRGKHRAQSDYQNRCNNTFNRFRNSQGRATITWGVKQQPPEKRF